MTWKGMSDEQKILHIQNIMRQYPENNNQLPYMEAQITRITKRI
jgi:hypothetical protein